MTEDGFALNPITRVPLRTCDLRRGLPLMCVSSSVQTPGVLRSCAGAAAHTLVRPYWERLPVISRSAMRRRSDHFGAPTPAHPALSLASRRDAENSVVGPVFRAMSNEY
jgi:hypothetical protein